MAVVSLPECDLQSLTCPARMSSAPKERKASLDTVYHCRAMRTKLAAVECPIRRILLRRVHSLGLQGDEAVSNMHAWRDDNERNRQASSLLADILSRLGPLSGRCWEKMYDSDVQACLCWPEEVSNGNCDHYRAPCSLFCAGLHDE